MNRSLRIAVPLALALLAAACPPSGPTCLAGQLSCSSIGALACTDIQSDPQNCGACGVSCGGGFACVAGRCECAAGATSCGSGCAYTGFDSANCGACGHACAAGQVCEAGECKASCALPQSTACGSSCVDLMATAQDCGACGHACPGVTSCHQGSCAYDVVVACSTNGELVGIQAGSDLLGPSRRIGPNRPLAVVPFRKALLVPDVDRVMNQARQEDLAQLGGGVPVGDDARFIVAEDPFVYVANSVTGTLQIFRADGGSVTGAGYALSLESELPLSATDQGNTYAQGIAKVGTDLYVPLQGGFGATASEGQKVLRIDVSDPAAPAIAQAIDLSTIDLRPFDGGTSLARPAGAVLHRGYVYVAVENLDPLNYSPAGPAMLAKIDPATRSFTVVDLGSDACLAPTQLASDGQHLFVGCSGNVLFDESWTAVAVDRGGLLALDSDDHRLASWAMKCPGGADAGCALPEPSRFAVVGSDVYFGDSNFGRVFVLDFQGNQFVERRGFSAPHPPLAACPVAQSASFSNAIDVAAVP